MEDIKTIFWNIGKELTDVKVQLLNVAISTISPDIFCIAEGSYSRDDCQKLVDTFSAKGYETFYSPLFPKPEEIKTSYVIRRYGLKIFVKDKAIIKNPFVYTDLREHGRIMLLRVFFKFRQITFIFLHNSSKQGETDDTLDQQDNIKAIYEMIKVGKTVEEKERIIIIGDFNLDPWARLLKHETHLNTSFFQNKNSILQRFDEKCFYNPIVDLLSKSTIVNLCGTHYGSKGWGVFDFMLYDTRDFQLAFDILTKFQDGTELLNVDANLKSGFLNHGLDHLPIMTTITKITSEYEQYE